MKKLALFSMMLMAAQAGACPGGHIRTLAVGDRAIAEIDMVENRVRIVDDKSQLLRVFWVGDRREVASRICGGPFMDVLVCDYDQGLLGVQLTEDPQGKLEVETQVDDQNYTFTQSDFNLPRGRCGKISQPD